MCLFINDFISINESKEGKFKKRANSINFNWSDMIQVFA
jgi:hypothetical protein